MGKFPEHYQLKGEEKDHFVIHDSRDKKHFKVAKKGIHPAHQLDILRLQKYSEGTPDHPVEKDDESAKYREAFVNDVGNAITSVIPSAGDIGSGLSQTFGSLLPKASAEEKPAEAVPTQAISPVAVPEAAAPTPSPQPASVAQPQTAAAPTAPAQAKTQASPFSTEGLTQSLNKYEGAVNAGARAEMAINQASMKERQPILDAMEATMKLTQANLQEKMRQYDQLAQDIASNKIDPQHYWSTRDSNAKMRAGIGILLSGLSGAKNNMAMEVIQKNIDRDIDAQKANLGKKQTLLADNLKIQGNIIAAEAATRAQYEAVLQGKLAQVAAKLGNPIIAEKAQKEIFESRIRSEGLWKVVAENEAKKQLAQTGGMAGQIYKLPTHLQKDAFQELGKYQEFKSSMGRVDQVMSQIAQNNTVVNRVTSPIQSKQLADQAEAMLFPIVKQIVGERMTDADARTLIKPYVTGVLSNKSTVAQSSNKLKEALAAKFEGSTPILSSAFPGFGSDIKDSVGPIKIVNGVKYKRGPKGEAIRVD